MKETIIHSLMSKSDAKELGSKWLNLGAGSV